MRFLILVLPAAAILGGCVQAPRPLYYWGAYEPLTYQAYVKPDKATPAIQIEKLEEDLRKAAAANLTPHPGLHAHLGYLYFISGRSEDAAKHFETEKRIFPESAAFIDSLQKAAKPADSAPLPQQPTAAPAKA